jgi:hypothetical protein
MNVPSRSTRRAWAAFALGAAAVLTTLAALTGTGGAATARTAWVRIDGPQQAGTQLGLLRASSTGDLHVLWGQGAPATLHDTLLSPSGAPKATTTVAQGFDGVGGLAAVGMADGSVRLFAAGGHSVGLPSAQSGINTYALSGSSWSLDAASLWGGAVASASDYIGATLTKDGQPVTAWKGFVHSGLGSGGVTPAYQADMGTSWLATDQASGAVVLAGETIAGKGGTFVQQVLPSVGPAVLLPSVLKERSSGIAARIGGAGTYVAYADGKQVRLMRYGGPARTLARGGFDTANVFSGPEGRLWIAWGDANDGLFVTRSNRAVSRFEPVQRLRLAGGVIALVQGEGSRGALDFFANLLLDKGGQGFWRTHVLARDALRATVSRTRGGNKVTFTLGDAGDPLAGAIIVVAHGGDVQRLKTDGGGHATATFTGGAHTLSAHADVTGYATASVRAHFG